MKARLPWWLSDKESTCQHGRRRFDPWAGKIPWAKEMATHLFLPGEFHGQQSVGGFSPCGCKRVRYKLAAKQQQENECQRGSFGSPSLRDSFGVTGRQDLDFCMLIPIPEGCLAQPANYELPRATHPCRLDHPGHSQPGMSQREV